jgi:hypothetical protein
MSPSELIDVVEYMSLKAWIAALTQCGVCLKAMIYVGVQL